MTRRKSVSPFRTWAELTRISNAPTVLTNVLVGVSVVSYWRTDLPQWGGDGVLCDLTGHQWIITALLVLSLLLIYSAGMVLNDWADREYDRSHARRRPIPSGRVGPQTALLGAIVLLLAGAGPMLLFGPAALLATAALIALVIAYDLLHRSHPWTAMLMGACRALVYATAAVAVSAVEPRAWWPAIIALLYTSVLTLIARTERGGGRRSPFLWTAWFLPLLIAVGLFFRSPSAHMPWTVIVGCVMGAWLLRSALIASGRRRHVGRAVLGWLSGFCLIDAFFLALLDQPCLSVLALGAWLVTAISHTRISGT